MRLSSLLFDDMNCAVPPAKLVLKFAKFTKLFGKNLPSICKSGRKLFQSRLRNHEKRRENIDNSSGKDEK